MDEGCVHVQATQFEFTIAVEQPKQYDGLKVTWTFDKEDGLRVDWTLNTMMDFLNQPLKSFVLMNEMMGFFRPNVLISDQRTYNKHDEDNLL